MGEIRNQGNSLSLSLPLSLQYKHINKLNIAKSILHIAFNETLAKL
jgi:hypothetical protein